MPTPPPVVRVPIYLNVIVPLPEKIMAPSLPGPVTGGPAGPWLLKLIALPVGLREPSPLAMKVPVPEIIMSLLVLPSLPMVPNSAD